MSGSCNGLRAVSAYAESALVFSWPHFLRRTGSTSPENALRGARPRDRPARLAEARVDDGERQDRGHEGEPAEEIEAGLIAVRGLADPADRIRADEAAEVADRVDERDAAGGGAAGEEQRRQ